MLYPWQLCNKVARGLHRPTRAQLFARLSFRIPRARIGNPLSPHIPPLRPNLYQLDISFRTPTPHPSPHTMPSRQRSLSSSSPPPGGQARAKRPKIFRACAACVASKTRCEDVSPAGCALCRRRGKECSLAAIAGQYEAGVSPSSASRSQHAGSAPPSHSNGLSANGHSGTHLARPASAHGPPSAPPSAAAYPTPEYTTGDDLRARLAETEQRLARTERLVADLEARLDAASDARHPTRNNSTNTNADADDTGAGDVVTSDTFIFAGPLRLSAYELDGHDETLWSVACTRAYPDPVGRGLLTPAEAELVWHGFKARVARLLPIPPFTAVSTPVPTHGFVMLAALHHVPALIKDQVRVKKMVAECMELAMASHSSIDVVLALLILSLAPPLPDIGGESAPTNPTAFRMLNLARSMCCTMGLEGRAIAALRLGDELNEEMYGDSLWILQLVRCGSRDVWGMSLTTVVRGVKSLRHPGSHVPTRPVTAAPRFPPSPAAEGAV